MLFILPDLPKANLELVGIKKQEIMIVKQLAVKNKESFVVLNMKQVKDMKLPANGNLLFLKVNKNFSDIILNNVSPIN